MAIQVRNKHVIGIDPGTYTGFAEWSQVEKRLVSVRSFKIHDALVMLKQLSLIHGDKLLVRIEDPTTWKPHKGSSKSERELKSKLQGAGSIKRDFSIWIDAMDSWKVAYEKVSLHSAPKKLKPEYFKAVTKYEGPTSEHGRDAAMLVYQYY